MKGFEKILIVILNNSIRLYFVLELPQIVIEIMNSLELKKIMPTYL